MDKELCRKCVQSKYSEKHTNSVCEVCYHIEEIGNGSNSHYIEKIEQQTCCNECKYIRKAPEHTGGKYYCKASESFDIDERTISMSIIRKNYVDKNTPKWCPLRNNREPSNENS